MGENILKQSDKQQKTLENTEKPDWRTGLNPKESEFVAGYTDGLSETYGRIVPSFLNAGYKERNTKARTKYYAIQLYERPKIQRAIALYQKMLWVKLDVNRNYALQRLIDTYDRAVMSGDSKAQVSCVKLMMQYNQMLSVNLNVNVEYTEALNETVALEAREIARRRINSIVHDNSGIELTESDVIDSAYLPPLLSGSSGSADLGDPEGLQTIPVNDLLESVIDSTPEDDE